MANSLRTPQQELKEIRKYGRVSCGVMHGGVVAYYTVTQEDKSLTFARATIVFTFYSYRPIFASEHVFRFHWVVLY